MQVHIKKPIPTPKSCDPEFWAHWIKKHNEKEFQFENGEPNFEEVAEQWEKSNS